MSGDPFPKSAQLARGERRYRRKVASPQQWQAIIAAKRGPCRVCGAPRIHAARVDAGGVMLSTASNDTVEWHHLIARSQGGDDVAENIVPLHPLCHGEVTARNPQALRLLAESLTDAEHDYVIAKLGEGGMERLFGGERAGEPAES